MTRWHRALWQGRIQWRLDAYFTAGTFAKRLDARYNRLEKIKYILTMHGKMPKHYTIR